MAGEGTELSRGLSGGRIEGIGIPELIWALSRARAGGVLRISRAGIRKSLYFNDGRIVFAASGDPDDRLGELLLRSGIITLDQLEDAIGRLSTTGKRLGTLLVEHGHLTPDDLVRGVVEQVRSIVLGTFLWEDGGYVFEEGPLPTDEVITLSISTGELLLQGIRGIQSFSRIRSAVGRSSTRYRTAADWNDTVEAIALTPGERELLDRLEEGAGSVHELCSDVFLSNFEVYRTLWGLRVLGVIEPEERPEPPRSADLDGLIDPSGITPVLVQLCHEQRTGVLHVSRGSQERTLHIRDGRCVFATSNSIDDGLIAYLLRRGVISLKDREETAKRLLSNKRVGTILLELGVLDDRDLRLMVREQIEEIVYGTMQWVDGEFAFVGGELPTIEEITLDTPLEDLVARGLRRTVSWSRVRDGMGGLDDKLSLTPEFLGVLDRMSVGPAEWEVVTVLKDAATPREVCAKSSLTDFRTCQILWTLRVLGAVEPARELRGEILDEDLWFDATPAPGADATPAPGGDATEGPAAENAGVPRPAEEIASSHDVSEREDEVATDDPARDASVAVEAADVGPGQDADPIDDSAHSDRESADADASGDAFALTDSDDAAGTGQGVDVAEVAATPYEGALSIDDPDAAAANVYEEAVEVPAAGEVESPIAVDADPESVAMPSDEPSEPMTSDADVPQVAETFEDMAVDASFADATFTPDATQVIPHDVLESILDDEVDPSDGPTPESVEASATTGTDESAEPAATSGPSESATFAVETDARAATESSVEGRATESFAADATQVLSNEDLAAAIDGAGAAAADPSADVERGSMATPEHGGDEASTDDVCGPDLPSFDGGATGEIGAHAIEDGRATESTAEARYGDETSESDVDVPEETLPPFAPAEDLPNHIERLNARQRIVFRTIRAEVGAGAANFVRSCCGRSSSGADPFDGLTLRADGTWDADELRDAVVRHRLEEPAAVYDRLIELEFEMLREQIGEARANALREQVEGAGVPAGSGAAEA